MEIISIIVMGIAITFLGVLISLSNERQRKAIDALSEQVVQWAIQDLLIKRRSFERDVKVDNPLQWLSATAFRICGQKLDLQIIETIDEPQMLICSDGRSNAQVIFTPMSPREVRYLIRKKHNRLSNYSNQISFLPDRLKTYEISLLNGGIMFDMEFHAVWNDLSPTKLDNTQRVWMYLLHQDK